MGPCDLELSSKSKSQDSSTTSPRDAAVDTRQVGQVTRMYSVKNKNKKETYSIKGDGRTAVCAKAAYLATCRFFMCDSLTFIARLHFCLVLFGALLIIRFSFVLLRR